MVDATNCLFLEVYEDNFAILNGRVCDCTIIEQGYKIDGIFGDMTEELFSLGVNVDDDLSITWPIDGQHHEGAIECGVELQDHSLGSF